jgi:hypothetical protein
MKTVVSAMLLAASLTVMPAPAHADPPPPPANCDQNSGNDPDCQPQHHRKFCGYVKSFALKCHHHPDPDQDPPPPADAPPPPPPDAPAQRMRSATLSIIATTTAVASIWVASLPLDRVVNATSASAPISYFADRPAPPPTPPPPPPGCEPDSSDPACHPTPPPYYPCRPLVRCGIVPR